MRWLSKLNKIVHRLSNFMYSIWLGYHRYDFRVDRKFASDSVAPYVSMGILQIMRAIRRLDVPDAVFYDIGCGKGNILILADMYTFKRVVGIELFKELHDICKTNISKYKKYNTDSRIDHHHCDARDFSYSDEKSIFYFFNPTNAKIFGEIIKKIESDVKKSEFFIILVHPVTGAYTDQLIDMGFQKMFENDHLFSRSIAFRSPPNRNEIAAGVNPPS